MKSFKDYYNANQKQYEFVLKLALEEINPKMKESIESSLKKYDIMSMTPFKETPWQEAPIDFPNIKNTKVFISNVVMTYPATPSMLQNVISGALSLRESNVAILTSNDPRLTDIPQFLERRSEEYKDNYKPLLGSEEKWDPESKYGNEQIEEVMKDHAECVKNRRIDIVTNSLIPDQKVEKADNEEKVNINDKAVIGTNDYRK